MLGVLGWTVYRYVRLGLARRRLGDVDLALRVQRQFPVLDDRLVSAVEFLHTAGRRSGGRLASRSAARSSPRRRPRAEDARFLAASLDPRPDDPRRRDLLAACVCWPAILWSCSTPSAAQIAVARLLNPFGNTAWPQTTHLAIRQPVERVARGQDFQIEVVDARGARLAAGGSHPLSLPTPDGGTVEETERMRFVDGAMVARRENVLRPFSYRVEGGDDQSSMPWTDVEVVEPPASSRSRSA